MIELLILADLATDDILHDPPPFVLQTALNDSYVAYELNAYTAEPKNILHMYSVLHQNIQDRFNEAGVEMNSPHYTSLRDCDQTTIPENYVPDDYKSPVFGIHETNASSCSAQSHQPVKPSGIETFGLTTFIVRRKPRPII